MTPRTISTAVCSVLACIVGGTVCFAGQKQSKDYRDAVSQSAKAARVFREIMRAPDKSVPRDILDGAECVAVFPRVLKAGFVVGARGGRGAASCRTARGWSGPAFFNLRGGSVGLQIGAQSTDFVLLFMNKGGLSKLMGDSSRLAGTPQPPRARWGARLALPRTSEWMRKSSLTRGAEACSPV